MGRSGVATRIFASGGLAVHAFIGRLLGVGFTAQCCLLAAGTGAAFLIGGALDGSLVLESPNVGLLQHPAIWAFLVLQIALPISIRRALSEAAESSPEIRRIAGISTSGAHSAATPLEEFLRPREPWSKLIASVVFTIGLGAFVWNTYQNQRPGTVVPFDFWDSKTFFWGFWLTRLYKFYLFVWLLPYLALIQSGILVITLRTIRLQRLSGDLVLKPFHPDGNGGLGFVPKLVTAPIVVTLLIGAIPTAAAVVVHHGPATTPLIGLGVLLGGAVFAYLVPIACLRVDILALKRDLLEELRSLQQGYYVAITKAPVVDFEVLQKGNEALRYFESVCTRVESISTYPHLKRLLAYGGVALTPSALSLALKVYERAAPVIRPLLAGL